MNKVMQDPPMYKHIVNKALVEMTNAKHESLRYVENVSHVTGTDSKEESKLYVNQMY